MSEKQNITLSLPKSLIRQAKLVAIEHETSLSGLMAELLTQLVEQTDQYNAAKRSHSMLLSQATDLGTRGNIGWTRDSLHER